MSGGYTRKAQQYSIVWSAPWGGVVHQCSVVLHAEASYMQHAMSSTSILPCLKTHPSLTSIDGWLNTHFTYDSLLRCVESTLLDTYRMLFWGGRGGERTVATLTTPVTRPAVTYNTKGRAPVSRSADGGLSALQRGAWTDGRPQRRRGALLIFSGHALPLCLVRVQVLHLVRKVHDNVCA